MNKSNRRDFVKQSALISSAFWIVPSLVLGGESGTAPSDKLNIAGIGVGARGADDLREMEAENIVALCDVDDAYAEKTFIRYENAVKYKDYRVLLDKQKDIDAVVIGTPDHTHAVIAMEAMRHGKHVYCEKPLAHNVHEIRTLIKASEEHKVITQVGNQGHSFDDIRNVCEWIWDGAIGPVHEVRISFNWMDFYGDGKPRPIETPPVPATLDWDLWLGPAPFRPYNPIYAPFIWRSWADFGTGILGDWICHLLDPAYWALDLGAPSAITVVSEDKDYPKERFPLKSTAVFEFPARNEKPPVKVTWTYGKEVETPEYPELGKMESISAIILGEKGAIVHGSHGGGGARIIPEKRNQEYKKPEPSLPRVPGGHQQEWVRACKEGRQANSNFAYGGSLTEVALLGVIATRFDEQKLEWDAKKARFTNNEKANELLNPPYREGWSL